MAYNGKLLAQEISVRIEARPQVSLSELCKSLRVDRHTIERCLLRYRGRCFREMKRAALLKAAAALLAESPALSVKQIATILGFSSGRSLSRFLKHNVGLCSTHLQAALTGSAAGPAANDVQLASAETSPNNVIRPNLRSLP